MVFFRSNNVKIISDAILFAATDYFDWARRTLYEDGCETLLDASVARHFYKHYKHDDLRVRLQPSIRKLETSLANFPDGRIDVVASYNGEFILIECKRYNRYQDIAGDLKRLTDLLVALRRGSFRASAFVAACGFENDANALSYMANYESVIRQAYAPASNIDHVYTDKKVIAPSSQCVRRNALSFVIKLK